MPQESFAANAENKENTEQSSERKYILDIDEIFKEFGIEDDEDVSADKVFGLLIKYQKEIAENLVKNQWRRIQSTLVNGNWATTTIKNWRIVRSKDFNLESFGDKDKAIGIEAGLGFGNREIVIKTGTTTRDEFIFSCDMDYFHDLQKKSDNCYMPEGIKFKGIKLVKKAITGSNPEANRNDDINEENSEEVLDSVKDLQIDISNTKRALEVALEDKDQEYPEVKKALLSYLKTKKGEEREDLRERFKKIYQAIKEFGNYFYDAKDKDSFSTVGDCLTYPNHFASFCKTKFGIELDIEHFGHPDYSELDERSYVKLMRKTKKKGPFHEINIFDKKLAIDWTCRQFGKKFRGRDTGYPAIFVLTDEEIEELYASY